MPRFGFPELYSRPRAGRMKIGSVAVSAASRTASSPARDGSLMPQPYRDLSRNPVSYFFPALVSATLKELAPVLRGPRKCVYLLHCLPRSH